MFKLLKNVLTLKEPITQSLVPRTTPEKRAFIERKMQIIHQ